MSFLIALPVLVGLGSWYILCLLADMLPYSPEFTPHCSARNCHSTLKWSEGLLLRRCPACKRPRGLRHWLLLPFILAISLYIWFTPPAGIGYAGGFLVFSYFTLVAIIDLEHHLILWPLSIIGILICSIAGTLLHGWISTLIGAGVGFITLFFFYLLGKVFIRLRKGKNSSDSQEEALGSGDVTLALILGLLLGWPLIWFDLLLGVLISGFVSLLIILILLIKRKYAGNAFMVFIPLGPGFIIVALIVLFFPQWMSRLLT